MLNLIQYPFQDSVSLLDSFLRDQRTQMPAVDVLAKKDSYQIVAELPGMDEKDVKLEINEGVLTIRGEKSHSYHKEEDQIYRSERFFGKFERSFRLNDVELEKIQAEFKNGVLTVNLPKKEVERPKQIAIKVS